MKKEFIDIIAETVHEFNLLEQEDKVLVAVSGGPDSVALVLSLLAVKKKYSLNIGIAHMNHMLREDESLADEIFVKSFAHNLDLLFHGEQTDVKKYAKQHRLSIEEAGRDVRYRFFEQTAKLHGYTKIATGHTKDDNVELVLMNLLRGAGSKGLSGIPAIRNNRYIRPLIRVLKIQILDFLTDKKQAYRVDSSNTDMAYLRNNIRHRLLPRLQSEYNPEIIDALDRLSRILRQEEDFWDMETDRQFNRCLIKTDNHAVALSKNLMSELHPAILNRVFRKAIWKVKKDLKRICLVHIEDMIHFCFDRPSGISLDLPGQIRVYKNKDSIIIKKEDKPLRQIGNKEKQSRRTAREKQGH
ncbi:tRNA lysidine(34) synthetase TilS [Desulfobacula phenolica]|uniref:tRNA(Ile)-lysidine synthase n=1 Tax=Desulfobacula phenolica TaxID=90732 RepID=A0A1H2IS43_9BACT|nr:tRNA lysidine(34) synthetase TilS [Desulfobacula phenolica]SDU46923.1 tRNA(Ile)-lysidine synthase [Desulfobacula phenolica]